MAFPEGESLESWLNKATHLSNRQEDWEYIIGFCDQINRELEGPQIAVKLLINKFCAQEWEALQALTVSNRRCAKSFKVSASAEINGRSIFLRCLQVLEACMKNCGRRFHKEIARYRFLNELIKVVSPMYLGNSTPEKVKSRIIEMLYSWTLAFPAEPKIAEAYGTIKKQGLVKSDPELPVDRTLIPSPPARPRNPVFDNEDMGKIRSADAEMRFHEEMGHHELLAELLRSKNPEDLQEANRLIKNMVKEDEARVQKITRRVDALEEVNNNVKLLSEMLSQFDHERSSAADRELLRSFPVSSHFLSDPRRVCVQELYERCDKLRSTAFKLATEAEDNDSSLGDILKANDDLSRVISSYKRIVEGLEVDGEAEELRAAASEGCETLIDLAGLDGPPSPPPPPPPPPEVSSANPVASSIPVLPPPPRRLAGGSISQTSSPDHRAPPQQSSLSLLDDQLLSLGLGDPPPEPNRPQLQESCVQWAAEQAPCRSVDLFGSISASNAAFPAQLPVLSRGLQELSVLDHGGEKSVSGITGGAFCVSGGLLNSSNPFLSGSASPALTRNQTASSGSAPGSPFFQPFSSQSLQRSPGVPSESSLTLLNVPLQSIRPSKVLPVTVSDKDGVRVLMHFAMDCPAGRPDVLVAVLSMLNTAPLPVTNIVFQAAVPKSMRVKLQPPSGPEIAPFNPLLPPASITQVMLLANPTKERVRLRFRLSYVLGERQCSEEGGDLVKGLGLWGGEKEILALESRCCVILSGTLDIEKNKFFKTRLLYNRAGDDQRLRVNQRKNLVGRRLLQRGRRFGFYHKPQLSSLHPEAIYRFISSCENSTPQVPVVM
ncbi:hypothetical protein DNTS_022115 [Danionella cerebrum]|uniref:VHS domain-containing protein n=1 Tax=Danionella cerebrum TaxID=2873325 RepID=A0A553R0L3_9TELE|nr:hypothetical protein DNTS_022115 [Danionella translucida]